MLVFLSSNIQGQIDTTRNMELRISLLGQGTFPVHIPGYYTNNSFLSFEPTVSYLQRLKNHKKLFFKSTLNFGSRSISTYEIDNPKVEGRIGYTNVFVGIERQNQFRYFGLFISAGIHGGIGSFRADFMPGDLPEVRNFTYNKKLIGIRGQATAFTNIGANIYLFATMSMGVQYEQRDFSSQITDDCCNDFRGLDSGLFYESFGVAYKF